MTIDELCWRSRSDGDEDSKSVKKGRHIDESI